MANSCDCHRCTEPEYGYDEVGMYIKNNLCRKRCETCGRVPTEYHDLGTDGVLECWWCNYRAGGSEVGYNVE